MSNWRDQPAENDREALHPGSEDSQGPTGESTGRRQKIARIFAIAASAAFLLLGVYVASSLFPRGGGDETADHPPEVTSDHPPEVTPDPAPEVTSDPAPEVTPDPPPPPLVQPAKVNYKFQEHMEGPLPFDYKPPVEPDELADMLVDQIKLGTYVLDQPEPLTAKRRTPAESFPDLGKQFWHIKNRSFPNLLGALLEDIPTAIEEATPAYGLMARAFSVAVTEDARAAAGFAEACLRLAPAEKLPEALERLAAAYCFAKEYDKLEALLAAGTEFRLPGRDNGVGLPTELAPLLAADAVGDDTDRFRALHLALLTGRRSSAVESLDRLSEESGRAAFEPLVRRLSEGLTVGLDEKARHRLDRRFDAMRRQLEAPRLPLHDRFADWPSERLEDHLRWCAATLGGHSDAAADILAYMVEQRDYRGLNVSAGTALCAGKRFCLRGEPARSLPMFLLAQKLGYLSEDGRFDEDGTEAMVSFNGFNSSVYFAKAIIEHVDLRNFVKEHEDIYRVAMANVYVFRSPLPRQQKRGNRRQIRVLRNRAEVAVALEPSHRTPRRCHPRTEGNDQERPHLRHPPQGGWVPGRALPVQDQGIRKSGNRVPPPCRR